MSDEDVHKLLVIIFPRKFCNNAEPAAHWVGPCQDSGETGARPKQTSASSSKKRKISSRDNLPGCSRADPDSDDNQEGRDDDRNRDPGYPVPPEGPVDDSCGCDVCRHENEASCHTDKLQKLSENEVLVAQFTINYPVSLMCPKHYQKTFKSFKGLNKACPNPLNLPHHQKRTSRLKMLSLAELADIRR